MLRQVFIVAFFCLFSLGCGDTSLKQTDYLTVRSYGYFGLLGVWKNECLSSGKANSDQDLLTVKDDRYIRHYSYHRGLGCNPKQVDYSYTYEFASPVEFTPQLNGYKAFSHSVQGVTLELKSKAFVDDFNKNKRYGLSDWGLSKPRSVAGLGFEEKSEPLLKENDSQRMDVKVDRKSLNFAGSKGGELFISNDPRLSFSRSER